MNELIREYKESLAMAQEGLKKWQQAYKEQPIEEYAENRNLYSGMVNNLKEAIQWMENGRDPQAYRGADRIDAYVMDHKLLEIMAANPVIEVSVERKLTDDERWMLEDALAGLTPNERKAFKLVRADRMTFEEVARKMRVQKGTIQKYVERAEKKIAYNKEHSFFLLMYEAG